MRYAVREVKLMRQKKTGLENLILITQLGLNVVTPVLLCVVLGNWIDKKTGLHTVLIFLILGVLSGGLSAYKMAQRIIDREKEEEEKERKEQVKQWETRFGTDDGSDRKRKMRHQAAVHNQTATASERVKQQ